MIQKYQGTSQPDPATRAAIVVIAVVVGFIALKLGEEIFAPLVMALMTGIILAPVMDRLERLHLPRSLAALLILLSGVLLVAALMFMVEPLIWLVIDKLPQIRWEIRGLVDEFRNLIRGLDEVNKQVEQALGSDLTQERNTSESAMPNLADALFVAPRVLAQVLIFLGTLYFFLLTRKDIYSWMSNRMSGISDTGRIEDRFLTAERLVSYYFVTITAINCILGVSLAGLLGIIGLPGAIIWGIAAALLNFVLYLGPAVIVAGLAIAGIVVFDGLYSFVPPLIFLALNVLESQFVTPTFVGRNISLNPLLIFVSLVFWLWLWGPVGGIIAIPSLLVAITLLDILKSPEAASAP